MSRPRFITPLKTCDCGGSLSEGRGSVVKAILYGFNGIQEVDHITKRCCRKSCQTTYGYNFKWEKGEEKREKVNTLKVSQAKALFVNDKTAFAMDYLIYHEDLQFRGYLSAGAIAWAGSESLFDKTMMHHDFHKLYNDARFLRLAMQEMQVLGEKHLKSIKIGAEVTDKSATMYGHYLHDFEYLPKDTASIKEIAADGHEKVLVKLCAGTSPGPRAGRPRKNGRGPIPYTNGWFVVSNPQDGRVLGVSQMLQPENNDVAIKTMARVLDKLPAVDCAIMDRMCKVKPAAEKKKQFRGIKYWTCDLWHGRKHSKKCQCNPHVHLRLKRRVNKVNTSIAEQVFSWMRGFARTFNELRPNRHRFLMHYYCKRHNELLHSDYRGHLNKFAYKNQKSRCPKPYHCTKKVVKTAVKTKSKASK